MVRVTGESHRELHRPPSIGFQPRDRQDPETD